MKMKNVLMIFITLAVVFSLAGAVSGAINPEDVEEEMVVNYTVLQSFTVTIPAAVEFSTGNLEGGLDDNLVASDVLIADGKQLVVTMTSTNGLTDGNFTLNYGSVTTVSKIKYNITCDNDQVTENSFKALTVLAGNKGGETCTIKFSTTNEYIAEATMSGNHTDTLTFRVSLEDHNPNP